MTHTFLEKFVDNIQPGMLENYKKVFEPCPLTVRRTTLSRILTNKYPFQRPLYLEMEQSDLERSTWNPLGSGEYKTTIRIYNQKNETFFELSTFYVLR
jgi:hypothetical protein